MRGRIRVFPTLMCSHYPLAQHNILTLCDIDKQRTNTVELRWLSPFTQEVAMTNPLGFDDLRAILQQRVAQLPDCRKGRNTPYRLSDAALGAFGLFFTQSPSFLEYQRRLHEHK